MVFENGVKNIQAAAYNGARMVNGNYDVSKTILKSRSYHLYLLISYLNFT